MKTGIPGRLAPSHHRLLLAVLITTTLAYLNSFNAAFQFDDYNVIVDNLGVHSLERWAGGLTHGIRPLLKLTYTLNWVSGVGLAGFHLVNLSIHLWATCMVYLLARAMCNEQAEIAGALAAMVFGLHPVMTEAVTYVSGRSASLMAALYLTALWAYHKRQRLWSLSLFIAAVLVKETALTLPFALMLWDMQQGGQMKDSLKRQAWHWAVLGVLAAGVLAHGGYRRYVLDILSIRDMGDNLRIQSEALWYLLARPLVLWARDIDPIIEVPQHWELKSIALMALMGVGVAGLMKRRMWGFALVWSFLHLLPTNSILPRLDPANERHLYLPMAGIALAAGHYLRRPVMRSRTVLALVLMLALTMATFTAIRNHAYRSERALWQATVEQSPLNPRAWNNLGYAYQQEGRKLEAMEAYQKALALDPKYNKARNNYDKLNKIY